MPRGAAVVLVAVTTVAALAGGCSDSATVPSGRTTAGAGATSHSRTAPSTPPASTSEAPSLSGSPSMSGSHPQTPSPSGSPSQTSSLSGSPSPSGSPSTDAGLLGREWEQIPTARHVVALTFDAGGDAAGVQAILDTLVSHNVPATFFLTGAWARSHPVRSRAIAATYRLGNHSMTHPHFTELTGRQIRTQIRRAAAAIRDVCGADPAPLFRFPYGDRDARTIAVVNRAGYIPVRWTVDTLGWEGTRKGISVDSIVKRVLAALQPGEIVLMHVGSNPYDHSTLDADALPRLISALRERGYGFVTLNALLTAQT